MAEIHVLDSETINRIAAGEVVERPVNVVKELTENAIDAGATAITIEIKNGGIDLVRVTDNGCGIEADQITKAFRRHATSKIASDADLSSLVTLGFRGEALSSIAAVSEVEMITKTRDSLTGTRARNNAVAAAASLQTTDVIPLEISEVGAPDGTTVIVRDLFYNVPVRKKFLKSPQTEGGYVTDLVEHLALSHPEISFHYRMNSTEKLHTTGNGDEKELIYRIYGREMANSVIPVNVSNDEGTLTGFLGRPEFSRSSRNFEIFFVNGRILHSDVLSKSLEEGYGTDLMQHRFPFAILHLELAPEDIDVNVHPAKMEVRFARPESVFDFIKDGVHRALHRVDLIPKETFQTEKERKEEEKAEEKAREKAQKAIPHTEQFETGALKKEGAPVPEPKKSSFSKQIRVLDEVLKDSDKFAPASSPAPAAEEAQKQAAADDFLFVDTREPAAKKAEEKEGKREEETPSGTYEQQNLFETASLPTPKEAAAAAEKDTESLPGQEVTPKAQKEPASERNFTKEKLNDYRIVGQVFKTYWIVEDGDRMLVIDQHAAHEKVNFERLMKRLEKEQSTQAPSQLLAPPIVVNLTGKEEGALQKYQSVFEKMGYEFEDFGDGSIAIRAVPLELYANEPAALLREVLDEILEEKMNGTPAAILYKIASMSCKAAVKGNQVLSLHEAQALIDELLALDNPYHCPHGRPTMIILTKQDMEKKFKRIV